MPPEDDHNLYDKDDEEPKTIHKKVSDTLKDKDDQAEPREKIRNDEESGDEEFYHPDAVEARERSLASAHETLSELTGGSKTEGASLYNPKDSGPKVLKSLKSGLRQRRKIAIGGGAAAGAGTVVLATFFLLVPLKIEHIVTNLEGRFFSGANSAVEQETQNMFERYMIRHVLPSYKACGSTISKDCSVRVVGNGPVSHLYRTWANARLENKLADNYGIEFKYDKVGKNWHLKAPGANPGGDNIGPDGRGLNTDFKRADRAAMRAAINDSIQSETRWKKVMYRYKVGRLLEEKYGIKRCIVFCGTRDKLADKSDKVKKKTALIFLNQRVFGPRDEGLAAALRCMLNNCDPTKTQPTTAEDGTTGELHGAPENPESDTAIREADQQLAAGFVSESADKLVSDVNDIEEKGLLKVAFERVLTKVGLGAIASQAADAVPIVGWVIAASHIISFVDHSGPALQKLGYIVNSTTYAQTWQMFSTYRDEIHTGHVNATEVGSLTDSLGPGDRGTPSDPQVGGTAGAENTALYADVIEAQARWHYHDIQ